MVVVTTGLVTDSRYIGCIGHGHHHYTYRDSQELFQRSERQF